MKLKKSLSIPISRQYLFSTVILFAFIVLLYYVQETIGYQTVSLILLLVIFMLPLFNFERGPIILAAVISALAWDYYFIPPHFTMHIASTEDGVMLFMFFAVALTNGILTSRLREQQTRMIENETHITALYLLVKDLSAAKDIDKVCSITVNHIYKTLGYQSAFYFPSDNTKLKRDVHPASNFIPDEMEWLAAESAFLEGKESGKSTGTVSGADAVYYPIKVEDTVLGIIGIKINFETGDNSKETKFLKEFVEEVSPFIQRHCHYSMP